MSAPTPRAGSSGRKGKSGSSSMITAHARAGSVSGIEPTPVALPSRQGRERAVAHRAPLATVRHGVSGALPDARANRALEPGRLFFGTANLGMLVGLHGDVSSEHASGQQRHDRGRTIEQGLVPLLLPDPDD